MLLSKTELEESEIGDIIKLDVPVDVKTDGLVGDRVNEVVVVKDAADKVEDVVEDTTDGTISKVEAVLIDFEVNIDDDEVDDV